MQYWKKLKEEYIYRGWRHMLRRRFVLPDGTQTDFDIFSGADYVTIAAVTEAEQFLLIRQFRPGPEQVLISFPEGAIDAGESPLKAARRELLEETGYEAGEIALLREVRNAYSTSIQYCVMATGCRQVQAQQLDPREFIEVFSLTPPDLHRLLCDPADRQFHNIGCAYMALDYLGLLTGKDG